MKAKLGKNVETDIAKFKVCFFPPLFIFINIQCLYCLFINNHELIGQLLLYNIL